MSVFKLFRASAQELRKTRTLVLTGLFAALEIVLGALELTLAPWLRIRFGFVFLAASGMLFGPVVAGMQGVVVDVTGYLLHPDGPFFPGYTLSALLGGILYGCCFYRLRMSWPRALAAKALVNVLLNIGLGTLWASMLYGKGYLALLATRAPKNLILLIVEVPLLVVMGTLVRRIENRRSPR